MGWKLRALFLSASMLLATACSGERQSALPDPVRVAANSAGAPTVGVEDLDRSDS